MRIRLYIYIKKQNKEKKKHESARQNTNDI